MNTDDQGFREIEHTADWSIEVWAPDMVGLLKEAAAGMYALSQTEIDDNFEVSRDFTLKIDDKESLVVDFLSELLYLGEMEQLAFNEFNLSLNNSLLIVTLRGGKITSQSKEIKAVTYHDLNIQTRDSLLWTNIVFDV
ncbi:MAG: archease [Aliifodinibius sp.]|nr:archease [Fodinibius sp.]NIW47399.1 archease [Gammaproteobacteria bacterium]NIY28581.1 archease [Fodinibius sp.]